MEYKKKRLNLRLSIVSICFIAVLAQAESESVRFVCDAGSVIQDLKLQATTSKYRLIVIPSIIALTLYAHQKKVFEMIETQPVAFALLAYFLGNCIIDSISKYRQIDQALHFFLFAQKMNRYMLCMFAIKNTMKKLNTFKNECFDEQLFLTTIVNNTQHSLQELENFNDGLMQSSMQAVSKLCLDINVAAMDEKFYRLVKEQISLEQILLLCKNDFNLHQALQAFYQNPENEFESIMKKVCFLFQKHFKIFYENKIL